MQNEERNIRDSHHEIVTALLEEFHDPDYREVYVNEFLNAKIATQIKVLREQRGWTQKMLAERVGMKQERISVLENVNYEAWTLRILRQLAKAFDLRINVSFDDFGSFLDEYTKFGRTTLERASFTDDLVFHSGRARRKRMASRLHLRSSSVNARAVQPELIGLGLVEVPHSDATQIRNKISSPEISGTRYMEYRRAG